MKNEMAVKKITLCVAFATTTLLAACGGGGGSSGAAPATAASAPAPASSATATTGVALQTSVPAASYAAGSYQAAAFLQINNYRNAMGVGLLAQDPVLDTAAQAHALYMFSNLADGATTTLDHNEVAGNANYYGDTPLLRAQKAGAPTTEWIAENIAAGTATTDAAEAADCIGQALASVYHLAALTTNQQTVGLGYQPGTTAYPLYTCDTEFGTSTGVESSPAANAFSYTGGQTLPIGGVFNSPYANETGVALAMRPESTNPAPDLAQPGRPILVRVNAQAQDTLTVSQFTLTDNTGASVAARILVPASGQTGSTATTVVDPNNLLADGVAVLLPLASLKANTTYTVTFSGARDGSAVSKTWSFTTAAS